MRHTSRLIPLAFAVAVHGAGAQVPKASLVDVDGHKVNVQVAGAARPNVPTVVFENGFGAIAATWNDVQSEIALITRTVAYDRAGTGGSELRPEPRTVKQFVTELRALLAKLDAPPPYVLVGHSYGGPIIHTYAAMFPKEVAGLVYVDPTDFMQTEADMQAVWKQAGLKDGHQAIADMFKQLLVGAPPGLLAEQREFERVERGGFAEFRAAGEAPDVPLSVLVAGKSEALPPGIAFPGDANRYFQATIDQRLEHFTRLVRRAANGHLVFTSSASHFIHSTEPELVSAEIRRVVSAATPRADLQRFVGEYPLAPTFVIAITREGEKLFLQATDQPKFQLFADSPTVFSLKVVEAKIEFEIDNGGKVTGLVLVQNGARQRAPKVK